MGNRFYTLQTRDSLNQCFWGGSFVSTVTFSALNRTENIISRSKLWLGWCMFHLRLLIFWTEGNVYLQSPAPTLIPGSRKNRSLLFYALKKTRALLFCSQHKKPRLDHAAVLYCAICPDTVMEDRSYSGSSNVIKQSKCALTRTECCFFAVFESVEGATRWRKSGWCLFHQRPLCRWHRAASSSKLPFVIGRRFEKVSLFIVYLPFNGKIGLNTL